MPSFRRIAIVTVALGWVPTLALVAVHWNGETHAAAQERTPIKVTHAEEYDVPLVAPRGATEVSEPVDVTSVQFRRTSPNYFIDWHTAPRKQYVITLSGESEVEIGDGTSIRLHPGHILLAEDLTGQGHISRAVGSEDRISLFLPLAEQ